MKNKTNNAAQQAAAKQKKQLVVLGMLALVLVAVVVIQFGGGESDAGVALAAPEADFYAEAEDAEDAEVAAPTGPVDINDVLSQAPDLEGMTTNPFKNFWNTPVDDAVEPVAEIAPPAVVLNGTLTADAEETPMALIDGSLRFLGDDVGGWELAEVRSRSVILRAPTQEWVVVEMPLLQAEVRAPVPQDG